MGLGADEVWSRFDPTMVVQLESMSCPRTQARPEGNNTSSKGQETANCCSSIDRRNEPDMTPPKQRTNGPVEWEEEGYVLRGDAERRADEHQRRQPRVRDRRGALGEEGY